jgi:hypothetical protein
MFLIYLLETNYLLTLISLIIKVAMGFILVSADGFVEKSNSLELFRNSHFCFEHKTGLAF